MLRVEEMIKQTKKKATMSEILSFISSMFRKDQCIEVKEEDLVKVRTVNSDLSSDIDVYAVIICNRFYFIYVFSDHMSLYLTV